MSSAVPQYYFGAVDNPQNQEIYSSYADEIAALTAAQLKKPLKECRVLDVGSGNGGVALELARRAQSVVGVEIVPALHERAAEKKRLGNAANAEFILGSVYNLPWKEEFDLAVFLTAIEHIPDHDLALQKIVRALKPGGVLYMTAPNKLWPFEQHYGLPFLSWLPLKLANRYVRAFKKAESFEDASYSLTYFGMRRLLNRFPLEYRFLTPSNVDAKVYSCGLAKGRGLYRFAKWLLDRIPAFWVISKGFIVVAKKK